MPHETTLNVFGAFIVGINVLIWLVARRLVKIDPGYFQTGGGSLRWWDIKSVSEVVRMIFDPQLPDPSHGPGMRKAIYLIRVLYGLGIVGAAFFFYIFFVHPQWIFSK
jgi:hypothetical protein